MLRILYKFMCVAVLAVIVPVFSRQSVVAASPPVQLNVHKTYLPMVRVSPRDDPTPPGVPNDLAGTWFEGDMFTQDLYDPQTGHWASPSGLGQMYRFETDKTYVYMGSLHIQNGGCVTDVSVYKQGSVRVAATVLTLQPTIAKTRTVTRCGNNQETITEGPFDPYQINWQVKYDAGGRLKLYIPVGETTVEYYKQGMAPALVGNWSLNGVASTNFYNPQTGRWAIPANDGAWFRFAPDGSYQFGEYGHGEDQQGCAFTYWVYQIGTVTVSGGQLRYQATSGQARRENACTPGQVLDEPYTDPNLYEFSWEVRDRETAPKLAVSPLGEFRYIIFDRE